MKRKEEADAAGSEATALDLLERAESVRILHPAQDVADGVLWYGLPADDALVVITSTRQAYRADRLPEGIGLRHTEPGPSTVSRELAVRWLTTGESGSIARALDALADFLTRYVVLRERRTALWIAAWALATWCYRAFRVFPYLSIRSSEKRCGKSRLLGLLARLLFTGDARVHGAQSRHEARALRGQGEAARQALPCREQAQSRLHVQDPRPRAATRRPTVRRRVAEKSGEPGGRDVHVHAGAPGSGMTA